MIESSPSLNWPPTVSSLLSAAEARVMGDIPDKIDPVAPVTVICRNERLLVLLSDFDFSILVHVDRLLLLLILRLLLTLILLLFFIEKASTTFNVMDEARRRASWI